MPVQETLGNFAASDLPLPEKLDAYRKSQQTNRLGFPIAYSEVNLHYTRRPEPSDVFPVLDALQTGKAT